MHENFASGRRRLAFTFETAVNVLIYFQWIFGVVARQQNNGDVMPATVADGRGANGVAAAVVGPQDADGAFVGVAVPADVDGVRAKLFAVPAPGDHGVRVAEIGVFGNFDPEDH